MSSSSNWKLCHSSNHAQHDSLFTAHRCFYFLVVFYGCCLCTCLNNQNFKPAKKAFKQGLLNQGAGTSVNVFSPPFFGGLNLFLVFGTSSHTCWWTATCPPRIPEDLCLSFSTEANWESPPPHSSRSMFNASVPQLSSWNWRYSLSVYPSVRLAASLLPSVFDMWHSGICLPSRWLPIRSFSQGACCSQEKNSTLMHPNVSVMQFSSSQGFSGVQLHPPPPPFFFVAQHAAPSRTFARWCGMRPPGWLQTAAMHQRHPQLSAYVSVCHIQTPLRSLRQFLFLANHLLHYCQPIPGPPKSSNAPSPGAQIPSPVSSPLFSSCKCCQPLASKHLEITPAGR